MTSALPLALLASASVVLSSAPILQDVMIPYDRTNPVIYANDDAIDIYTDEYLFALAAAGEIELRGIITSSPVAPHNAAVTEAYIANAAAQRGEAVALAIRSGL